MRVKIHRAVMWPVQQYLSRLAEAAVKSVVTLLKSFNTEREGSMSMYSGKVQFLLKRYEINDDVANVSINV